MIRWISKKGRDGKVYHIPIFEGQRQRERVFNKRQSIDDILNNLEWETDIGYAFTDYGENEGTIYRAYFDDYVLEVYPTSLVHSDENGWEFRIINRENGVEYDSLEESNNRNDHAKTPEQAQQWAIETFKTFLEEE